MNCQELHSYFEERRERISKSDSAEFAEHLAICGECNQWLVSRKRVRTNLDLLRQSAPSVPANFDAVVLTSYRKRMAEREATASLSLPSKRIPAWLQLGLAIAGMLLIAAVIFALRRPAVTAANKPQLQLAPQVSPPIIATKAPVTTLEGSEGVPKTHTRRRHSAADQIPATSALAIHTDSSRDGFRSLMYCDELICDGGMEVVRVQFSPTVMGVSAVPSSPSRVAYADVLVGADGFARGIRIEQ